LSDVTVLVVPPTHLYRLRPVLVVTDLALLNGPAGGTVELPIWLFWSGSSPEAGRFRLDNPVEQRSMYATVLREAGSAADLITFLNRGALVEQWPAVALRLPRAVRAAWEKQHGVLARLTADGG
jgi:hypothetical protein